MLKGLPANMRIWLVVAEFNCILKPSGCIVCSFCIQKSSRSSKSCCITSLLLLLVIWTCSMMVKCACSFKLWPGTLKCLSNNNPLVLVMS